MNHTDELSFTRPPSVGAQSRLHKRHFRLVGVPFLLIWKVRVSGRSKLRVNRTAALLLSGYFLSAFLRSKKKVVHCHHLFKKNRFRHLTRCSSVSSKALLNCSVFSTLSMILVNERATTCSYLQMFYGNSSKRGKLITYSNQISHLNPLKKFSGNLVLI